MPSVPTITSTWSSSPAAATAAPPAGADRAGGVRLVDDEPHPVARCDVGELRERRDIAVHREHAVGDDQGAAALGLLDAPSRCSRSQWS